MILLLACQEPTTDPTPVDSAEPAPPVPDALTSPPEAEDLDPAEGAVRFALRAEATADGFAYNGTVPGPTLRAKVGDAVTVELTNALAEPTTIHWHGLSVPFAMDGATWQVDPVAAGSSFTYTFTVETAGTFWYHPHIDTAHQVDRGLYGVFVVEDPTEPEADAELILVFDADDEEGADDHGAIDPDALVWRVNGVVEPTARPAGGSRVRVRALNAANTGYLDLTWSGMRRIAGDQGLDAAVDLAARHLLAPGDRAEFEWDIGERPFNVIAEAYVPSGGTGWNEPRALIHVEPDVPAPFPAPMDWPVSGALPTPDTTYTDLVYVFSGGAEDADWLINGEAWPDVTISEAPRSVLTVIEVRNLSATEHPFHLHGNAFEVLSVDGVAPGTRVVADTWNVPIRSVARFGLTPTNPGEWMLHCHLLDHAEHGMMTLLRVPE